jgi:hypothetical protein
MTPPTWVLADDPSTRMPLRPLPMIAVLFAPTPKKLPLHDGLGRVGDAQAVAAVPADHFVVDERVVDETAARQRVAVSVVEPHAGAAVAKPASPSAIVPMKLPFIMLPAELVRGGFQHRRVVGEANLGPARVKTRSRAGSAGRPDLGASW